MAETEKAAEEKPPMDEAKFLAWLDKESKEFDRDSEIERIMKAFRANAYDVLDLQPGVPEEDIKKTYRRKSLLIHPDKAQHHQAQEAFDRLAKAHQTLMDEKLRKTLDEAISDARTLLLRDLKLTTDSEEARDPDTAFVAAWKEKIKWVLADNEARRRRQMQAQMREEGRERIKLEQEAEERKRKREHEVEWERTREKRIESWRSFAGGKKGKTSETNAAGGGGGGGEGGGKKKKAKLKVLG